MERLRRNPEYEIIEIAEEYTAVPVGSAAETFHGVVALNEAAYFLLSNMTEPKTMAELVALITSEYDVDDATAEKDIAETMQTLKEAGVVCE